MLLLLSLLLLAETKIYVPVIPTGRSLNNKIHLKTLQVKNRKKVFWQLATDIQEQPFAGVLLKRCSEQFRKFHKKTPVLESLFNKIAGHQPCNYIKKRLQHNRFPAKFPKILRTNFFTEHLRWLILDIVILLNILWQISEVFENKTLWKTFDNFFYFSVILLESILKRAGLKIWKLLPCRIFANILKYLPEKSWRKNVLMYSINCSTIDKRKG